ncbi:MAG: TIGR03936 family radical SAM-associated protein [Eggerthellaceae bacterium]
MPDPNLFRLRMTFCKQGRLAMLSHLEVARALERAVRRAGLPFAVSQGFSPHMKIAFGAALPVGVGGTHELADLQMTRYVPVDEALEALQRASVPDLMVKACDYIGRTRRPLSAAYPIAVYRALLSHPPTTFRCQTKLRWCARRRRRCCARPISSWGSWSCPAPWSRSRWNRSRRAATSRRVAARVLRSCRSVAPEGAAPLRVLSVMRTEQRAAR